MNMGDVNNSKVREIKTLKKKQGEEEARNILNRVAKQVQPIMRKHNWRVKLLSEFCPKNPALLGLNVGGGVHVKLRLRRPNRDSDFFPFDQILDTMLHELCHNVHGPHDANFYKLWDDIRKECEDLMTRGITGTAEGFDLPGRRLGGFSCQPTLSSLRQTALAAAEKRARLGSLLPSGPKRLGGDCSIMVALSPTQAAAMAAERRLQDDIWCGSENFEVSGEGENGADFLENPLNTGQNDGNLKLYNGVEVHASDAVSQKRSHKSDINSMSPPSNCHPESKIRKLATDSSIYGIKGNRDSLSHERIHQTGYQSFSQSLNGLSRSNFVDLSNDASTSGSILDHGGTHNAEEFTMWQCLSCTLLNPTLAPLCELCSTQKPKDDQHKYNKWSCKFCTLENSVKLEKCSACEQWRYSHGPPVASSAPNLGT